MPAFTDTVVIEVDDTQVQQVLYRLELATSVVGQREWATTQIDPWMQARAASRFSAEGDDASGKWLPLTAFTREWRQMQGYPPAHPINERSGAFRDMMTGVTGDFMPANSVSGDYYWPGVALAYDSHFTAKLKVAQQGARQGENKMLPNSVTPARPVVAINSVDVLGLLLSFHDYIEAFVGDTAASIFASGTFGGTVTGAPSGVTGSTSSGGGGNFS